MQNPLRFLTVTGAVLLCCGASSQAWAAAAPPCLVFDTKDAVNCRLRSTFLVDDGHGGVTTTILTWCEGTPKGYTQASGAQTGNFEGAPCGKVIRAFQGRKVNDPCGLMTKGADCPVARD